MINMLKVIGIILLILLWIGIGFCTFLIDAKLTYRCNFDRSAKRDLIICIIFSVFPFIIIIGQFIYFNFEAFMDNLLKKINK